MKFREDFLARYGRNGTRSDFFKPSSRFDGPQRIKFLLVQFQRLEYRLNNSQLLF